MGFLSDPDQLRRAAAGERAAVAALVKSATPAILALATRMLADRMEAEDVTQETFLRAWKVLPSWQPGADFSTWLHRVALNLCYDRLRRRRHTVADGIAEIADAAPGPHERLDQAQRINAVELAISRLPERQAAALVLCAIQGFSQVRAAEILEVSVEALESLLARARRTLKAQLAVEGGDA